VSIIVGTILTSHFSKDPELVTASSFLHEMEGVGISEAGVVRQESSINFGPKTVTVIVSGFVRRSLDGGDPDWAAIHATVMTRLKELTSSLPPEKAPDAVGSALTTGFNLGIFKSHETVIRIENARTGEVIQNGHHMDW